MAASAGRASLLSRLLGQGLPSVSAHIGRLPDGEQGPRRALPSSRRPSCGQIRLFATKISTRRNHLETNSNIGVFDYRCVQPAADLRQFNRAQVLYDALYNHLYTSDAPLIQVLYIRGTRVTSRFTVNP